MKNIFRKFFIPLILFSVIFGKVAIAEPAAPVVAGEGMVLMDAETGKIITSKNATTKLAPASTTKVMTALLTLENCKLTDIVTVGKNPPFAEGSSIALKEGDQYTVEDLLYGLLLESANDCAMALAEHVSGSEEAFVKLMNERAKSLGATNTHFINSSGLFEDNHLTTPYDLALITREASENEDFVRISAVTTYELPTSKIDGQTKWVNNLNSLIYPANPNYYEPLIAGKTGYTTKSRSTYTAVAEKNGQKLILTLFKYESKSTLLTDAINIFNYGFDNFNLIKLYNKGDTISSFKINDKKTIPLIATDDIYYVGDSTKLNKYKSITELRNYLNPVVKLENKDLSRQDINKGDIIVNSDIYIGDSVYTSLPLASGDTVKYGIIDKSLNNIYDNKVISLIAVVILIILLLLIKKNNNKRSRKKRFNAIINNSYNGTSKSKKIFSKRKNKYK